MPLRASPAVVRPLVLACLAAVAFALRSEPAPAGAQTTPPPVGVGYRLVDTWTDVPPRPGPGRFGDAADISSAPDGTVYVLDRAQNALHVLGPDGTARVWWPYPVGEDGDGGAWRWLRLDVGFDGRPHLLARGSFAVEPPGTPVVRYRVDILAADGSVAARRDLGTVTPERYVDLAVRSDGRVYLTRTSGNVARFGTHAIEVLAPDGTHGPLALEPSPLTIPLALDVAADGTLYVVDQFPHSSMPPGPGKVDGVAVFGPDGAYQRTIQFTGAMDVAVGPAGIFVSKDNEVYGLGERPGDHRMLYGGPTVQKNPYRLTALGVPSMFSLDVPPNGGPLRASMTHCSFQGVLAFDLSGGGRGPVEPTFSGALDLPSLRGPIYPLRMDAGARVALLQGRFEPATGPGLPVAPFFSQLYTADPQTVQHWAPDGSLLGQMGTCGVWNAPLGVSDLAVDGDDIYTIDAQSITRRPDDRVPLWRQYALAFLDDPLALPHLTAVAADGGRVAVLDAGSRSVLLLDAAGELVGAWSSADVSLGIPTDIGLAGSRLIVSYDGSSRFETFDLDLPGASLSDLLAGGAVTPAPIRAAAIGPTGEVVALGTDGWVYRYRADDLRVDGRVDPETAWPLPDSGASARDIAVDDAGRVHVAWVDASEPVSETLNLDQHIDIRRGGVWVYQPFPAVDSAAGVGLDDPECITRADKAIEPQAIRLGETLEVKLRVDGTCRGERRPLQLAIVINTSKQMNNDNGLDRAKAAVIALLGRLSGYQSDMGVTLVSFSDQARLDVPFTNSSPRGHYLSEVAAAVASLDVAEGTDLAGALELAGQELARVKGDDTAVRQAVLMVTDGGEMDAGDDPTAAAAALRAAGVTLYAEVHPYFTLRAADLAGLTALVGGEDQLFTTFTPEAIDRQLDVLTAYAPSTRLPFETVDIRDQLPQTMRYVEGSAVPPATYDAAARELRWEGVAADQASVALRYRVEPLTYGSWLPVGLRGGVDADGGHLADFPIPAARVRGVGEVLLPVARVGVR